MAEQVTFDILARDRASATFSKIGQSTEALETRFTRLTRAATGIAATLVGAQVGKSVLEAADQFELSRSRLETITKNIGGNFDGLSKQVDAADKRMAAFGYTSADTEGSLAALESVTKNPTKALADLGLAADIARGRNIGLSEATLILQRVETGHVAQLAKLGIATKDANGHLLTQAQALQMLTDLYGGAASNYAGTFAGKQAAVAAEMKNAAAQIGVALLPAAVDLANALQHDVLPPLVATVEWFDRNRKTIEPLVKALLVGVGVWKLYGLATKGAAELTALVGTRATATATRIAAASAIEAAATKRATATILPDLRAVAMAEDAASLAARRRMLAIGTGAVGAGALAAGAFTSGATSNALTAGGSAAMLTAPLGPEVAIPAGLLTAGVVAALSTGGDTSKQRQNSYLAQALSGPQGLAAVQAVVARTTIPKNTAVRGGGTVSEMHDEAAAALKLAQSINAAKSATVSATNATQDYGTAAERTAQQIASHAQKTINFKQAQDAVRQAMHDAAQTAADSGRTLQGNSDAALANRNALMNQATAVLNVINVMKQNGSSAAHQSTMLEILTQAVETNAVKVYGNKAAVDALLRSLGLIPGAVDNAAAALATLPAITQAAFSGDNVSPGALHQLSQAVATTKATAAKQGADVAKSFTDGYTPIVAKVPKAAKDAANKAAEAFNKLKDQMKSDLQTISSAVDSTRSSVAGFADFSATGTDALGASGLNTDVTGQLKAKASRLEQFARVFNQLDRAGLDAHLMAQFAQIGPDAIPAMQAMLHAGRGYIRQVNRIEQRIQTAAGQVATTTAAEQNSGLIHKDLTTLPAKLGREFAKGLKNVHVSVSLRETDRKNGIAVVTAP